MVNSEKGSGEAILVRHTQGTARAAGPLEGERGGIKVIIAMMRVEVFEGIVGHGKSPRS